MQQQPSASSQVEQSGAKPACVADCKLGQLELVLEGCPLPCFIIRIRDDLILLANTKAKAVLSSPGKPFIGQSSLRIGLWSSPAALSQLMEVCQKADTLHNHPLSLVDDQGHLHSGLANVQKHTLEGEPCLLVFFSEPGTEEFENLMREERTRLHCRLETQKMEAIGNLASSLAHDFNNILAAIMLRLELMSLEAEDAPALRQAIQELGGETKRAAGITRQLLLFSRKEGAYRIPMDLNALLDQSRKRLGTLAGKAELLHVEIPKEVIWINGDAEQITQALEALVANARDACNARKPVSVHAGLVKLPDNHPTKPHRSGNPGYACIMVADQGCGMDEGTRQHLFEPFFTTKQRKGAGMSLASVYGIMQQHQGWIEVDSKPGHGTVMTLYFPALDQALQKPQNLPLDAKTLLLVEEDPNTRRLSSLLLRHKGHQVLEACSGREALAQWNLHHNKIDAILIDLILPDGMLGTDLLTEIHRTHPKLPCLIISNLTKPEDKALIEHPEWQVLQNPFSSSELLSRLAQAFQHATP